MPFLSLWIWNIIYITSESDSKETSIVAEVSSLVLMDRQSLRVYFINVIHVHIWFFHAIGWIIYLRKGIASSIVLFINAKQYVGPYLDPKYLALWWYPERLFLKTAILRKYPTEKGF